MERNQNKVNGKPWSKVLISWLSFINQLSSNWPFPILNPVAGTNFREAKTENSSEMTCLKVRFKY